ncbi:MAG: hypothetical protein ACRDYZ_10885 [Acidimicrobiales bacterium]
MPFDFYSFAAGIGLDPPPLPDLPPPALVPLRMSVRDATVGLFVSCGVRLVDDEPLGVTNDLSFRLVPRDAAPGSLVLDHESPIRAFADDDLAVAYPRDRLVEMEKDGVIGRLADDAVSMVGSITLFDPLLLDTAPRIAAELERQSVDLVLLAAFCPGCHRSVSLIARALEKRGIPTVTLVTVRQIAEAFKPPRAAFLDYPPGCPAGRPHDPEDQRAVLTAALDLAAQSPDHARPWGVHYLPFEYRADGSRSWEDEVKQLYRDRYGVLASHVADHATRGQSLAGGEEDFVARCNC